MRKYFILSLSFMSAACAWFDMPCEKELDTQTYFVDENVAATAQSNEQPQNALYVTKVEVELSSVPYCAKEPEPTCTSCLYKPNPCRAVLHPRVTEVKVEKKCPNCPMDKQAVLCGQNTCSTFKNAEVKAPCTQKISVPAASQAYILAANRTFSRILVDISSWCSQKPSLYVQKAEVRSQDLPAGVESGIATMKNKLLDASMFELTENASGADYFLETSVDWFDTPTKTAPAILYRTALYDKNHQKIDEWVEVVRQTSNQSWL